MNYVCQWRERSTDFVLRQEHLWLICKNHPLTVEIQCWILFIEWFITIFILVVAICDWNLVLFIYSFVFVFGRIYVFCSVQRQVNAEPFLNNFVSLLLRNYFIILLIICSSISRKRSKESLSSKPHEFLSQLLSVSSPVASKGSQPLIGNIARWRS